MAEVLIRYAHFLGILVFASLLVAEHLLVKDRLSVPEIKRILIVDAAFGISAIVVLAAGLSLWLWVGKPANFYTANPVFHAKLTAFVLIALLSIYPTRFYFKHRKTSADFIVVPKAVVNIIRLESMLLVIIPLLAVIMARGIGLN